MSRTVGWFLTGVLVIAGAACGTEEPASDRQQQTRRVAVQGPLRLAPSHRWIRLNPEGPALVSPALSSDGRWVAASGLHGVGLYVTSADGGVLPELIDADYRGPRAWSETPVALHFGHHDLRAWRPGGRGLAPGQRLWHRPWTEERGRLLRQAGDVSWYHHPRRGIVTRVAAGEADRIVAPGDAWGVRVSPDGHRVAWSTGTLAAPRLHVLDARTGDTRDLGPGVHPAWFPTGARLVYARPDGVRRVGGQSNVSGAELCLFDGATGRARVLTDTPRVGEMQPVVAADGRSLVFADWLTGSLYRAVVLGGGTP